MTCLDRKFVQLPGSEARGIQLSGVPPAVASGPDGRATFPPASIAFLVPDEGSFLLIRYSPSGEFAGDTWHASEEDAAHQVMVEYGVDQVAWQRVPTRVRDLESFVREHLSDDDA